MSTAEIALLEPLNAMRPVSATTATAAAADPARSAPVRNVGTGRESRRLERDGRTFHRNRPERLGQAGDRLPKCAAIVTTS